MNIFFEVFKKKTNNDILTNFGRLNLFFNLNAHFQGGKWKEFEELWTGPMSRMFNELTK